MNIISKKIEDLTPYENNPRHNEDAVEPVANSIKEFGFKVPIVIDADGVIVSGHTRYKAAQKLKMKEVPCIVADDLSPEQIKAFRLADNKVGEIAQWDNELLKDEIKLLDDFDMSDFGFSEYFLDNLYDDDIQKDNDVEIEENISVIIQCENDEQAEKIFNRLTEEGYQCRISTL